jgi:hypothetical protein
VRGWNRRSLVGVGVAVAIAAPATAMALDVGPAVADSTAQSSWRPQLTPIGRATPAATAPDEAPAGQSPWVSLSHPAPFSPGTMLLGSDGTVYVHSEPESGGTADWWKLTPDAHGSYVDGTWTQMPSMPGGYDPLYFSSAILPDGHMIVEGGEYLGGNPVWTNKGAEYNPLTNSWKRIAPPPGWTNIGDAEADVLSNGTYIQSQACQDCTSSTPQQSTAFALYNATGHNWLTFSGAGKNDPNDEEGWTLMPSGQMLTVDTWLTPTTELFTPSSLTWSNAGNTLRSPVNTPSAEIGPQAGMPGGNVFVVGAGSGAEAPAACTTSSPAPTALYNDAEGRWVASPAIPTINGQQYDSADGPSATLPDGNVLFDVSPCVYNAPIAFDLYNAASNTITSVPNVPNAANDSTYYTRLLDLPNGQVLFNDGSNQLEVYTAGGSANPSWAPSISSISKPSLAPGKSAILSGTQLSGLDQGAAYGDDVQDATNFPVVRITNTSSGVVTYARTSQWSSVSVAPGASSSTRFTVRAGTPAGPSTVEVIANGIASAPVPLTIK